MDATLIMLATYAALFIYGCYVCHKILEETDELVNQGKKMTSAKEKILLDSLRAIAAVENQMYGGDWDEIEQAREIAGKALEAFNCKFVLGERVRKNKGSQWQGRVVGTYSTELTPEGYAVESEAHPGSVQIYPASALELVP